MMPIEAAVELLVATTPALREQLQEHREEFGETLPTVFFGEVAGWAAREVLNGSADAAAAFTAMELLLSAGAPDVQDLVVTGFLEGLSYGTDADDRVLPYFGPNLRRELDTLLNSK